MMTKNEWESKCQHIGEMFTETFIKAKAETDEHAALVAMTGALAACATLENVPLEKVILALASCYNDIKEPKL